jgi:hypothetical protein
MGLLQEIAQTIGSENLQRLSGGKVDVDNPNSPDMQHAQEMIKNIDPDQLRQIFAQCAQKIDPQQYSDHVTPGAGGTNPLGNLSAAGLGSIASVLVNCLKKSAAAGGASETPLEDVPGLQTADPKEMDADDVAAVARYAQANHPDAFGQAASQIAQKQPALIHSFLGKAALAVGVAALASHFIKPDRR